MNYDIIACDLDGTLLGKDMAVSAENADAIRKMTEAGVYFVPATGRSFGEMPAEIRTCPYIRYFITSNGASIYDRQTGKSVFFGIDNRKVNEIMDVLDGFATYMTFHAGGKSGVDASKNLDEYAALCHMDGGWVRFVREYNTPVENFGGYVRSRTDAEMFCVFFDSPENVERGKKLIEGLGGLRVSSSARYNIEIFSERCGKGASLLCLCDMLGVPRSRSLAAGDSLNDISMIEAAGLGVCVENASGEVKRASDRVICANTDHAARYIAENILDGII